MDSTTRSEVAPVRKRNKLRSAGWESLRKYLKIQYAANHIETNNRTKESDVAVPWPKERVTVADRAP
jgi:hypothetical protein